MSTLDNLVSKIIADSEVKAKQIIDGANEQAKALINEKTKEANQQKEELVSAAKAEAQMVKSQYIAAKQIEIRDEKLKAKQEMIEKAFQLALERLKGMDKEAYTAFLESYLTTLPINGDEQIVVPDQYQDIDLSGINEKRKAAGQKGELSIYSGNRKVDGGFILLKDGMENNNTYESLLDFYRDELEKKVVETLL